MLTGLRRRMVPRLRRALEHAPDAGFTLTEVLVSLALLGVVMGTLTTFFVNSMSTVHQQRDKQGAVQVAADGIEMVRAMKATDLLAGRQQCTTPCQPPVAGVSLGDMQEWDRPDGTRYNLPFTPDPQDRGVPYTRYWYVGKCWQPVRGGNCTANNTAGAVEFVRVVVAVTWPQSATWTQRKCPDSICSYATSTLVSATPDPLFNSNDTAPPAVIANVSDQASDVNVYLTLQLNAYGPPPLSWSISPLPPGLQANVSGQIWGTPTTPGTTTVTATVLDGFDNTTNASFAWTVNPLPQLVVPATQWTVNGTPVSLPMAVTGGTGPMTWAASGLPTGLSINSTTGVISGTPDANGQQQAITVTVIVTDASNQQASASFTWNILPGYTNRVGDVISMPKVASGSTFSAQNLPAGLSIDSSTGVISGTLKTGTRYLTTVSYLDASNTSRSTTFYWQVLNATASPNGLQVTGPTGNRTDPAGVSVTSFTATATGGSGQGYSWKSNSSLPPGLTISTAGKITGTPSTKGTWAVKLTVTDSKGNTADFMFVWTVQ